MYFLYALPTYIVSKTSNYQSNEIWFDIRYYLLNSNYLLKKYYRLLRYKASMSKILVAVLVNFVNMVIGLINFKKKWWYYVILLISILLSLVLVDCWWILYTEEWMLSFINWAMFQDWFMAIPKLKWMRMKSITIKQLI